MHAIRETDGVVLAVTDEEILEAKAVVDGCGRRMRARERRERRRRARPGPAGLMAPDQHAVAVLTGHILKDPGLLLQYHREMEPPPPGANRPIEIEAELGEVERVLGKR